MLDALRKLLGGKPEPQEKPMSLDRASYAWKGVDDLTQPAQFNRVLGNLEMENASRKWGFTPKMRGIASATNPVMMSQKQAPVKGVRGEYMPDNNETQFYGHSPSGYVPAHEFLHSAWQGTPKQSRQNFLDLLQTKGSPQEQAGVNRSIDTSLYNRTGAPMGNYSSLPENMATEAHSYGAGFLQPKSKMNKYYSQYFNTKG